MEAKVNSKDGFTETKPGYTLRLKHTINISLLLSGLLLSSMTSAQQAKESLTCPSGSQPQHWRADVPGGWFDMYQCRAGKQVMGKAEMEMCYEWDGKWNGTTVPCGSRAGAARIPHSLKPRNCPSSQWVYLYNGASKPDLRCLPSGWVSVPPGEKGCPAGFVPGAFFGGNADACLGPRPEVECPGCTTAEKNRAAMARSAQISGDQLLPDRHWQYTATGMGKQTLKISMPSITQQTLNGLFRSGQGYAQFLWKNGFQFTVVTDGRQYWAALLAKEGYQGVQGPYTSQPTAKTLTASQSKEAVSQRHTPDNPDKEAARNSLPPKMVMTEKRAMEITMAVYRAFGQEDAMLLEVCIKSGFDWDNPAQTIDPDSPLPPLYQVQVIDPGGVHNGQTGPRYYASECYRLRKRVLAVAEQYQHRVYEPAH